MGVKKKEKEISPLGRVEPEFKFDIVTIAFFLIGSIISWLNMLLILASMEVWAFLSIIFISSIPGVIIAYKNRYWGYGFMVGYSIAGIPFMIFVDLFIGGYVFATALFIFIIMWLVFWKTWRSLSAIKRE
ncbi:MAG: hypothetical protein ACFFAH_13165 [Promethearchaeota archaeon]